MVWNMSLGIGLKNVVWYIMQGATCMVPNAPVLAKMLRYKKAFQGVQFATAAGLSFLYSYKTSDWFFDMRNFALHSMDLYTKSEIAAAMPLKELVPEEERSMLHEYGMDPDGTVGFTESQAVIHDQSDEALDLWLEWSQVPEEPTSAGPRP
jgi:hypothetical protein